MANFQTNTNNGYYAILAVTETSQSIPNNTTQLHYALTLYSGSKSFSGYTIGYDVRINGTQVAYHASSGNQTSMNANSSKLIVEGNTTITHNSDGTKKNMAVSVEIFTDNASYLPVSLSKSGTMDLTTIPRYATSVQSLNTKTSSSIKMNWSSDNTIDYIWYSKDNGSNWTAVGSVNATSGNYTISGLSSNTTYKIKTRVRRKDSQLTTDSSVLSVTTYEKTAPTISLSSKTINSITVTSGCNVTTSSTQYRIKTSSGSYGSYQDSATFTGLSANTAYVIEVKKVGKDSGESGTATLSVTTYNKATISSAPNFNHGATETVTFSNPSGQTTVIGIYNADGSAAYASYRTCTGSSYKFTFTDAELDAMYKSYGTGSTLSARVYIRTTCNSTNYYDYKAITITLKGDQKTIRTKISGNWRRGKVWLKVSGNWKQAVVWEKVNGSWRRGI